MYVTSVMLCHDRISFSNRLPAVLASPTDLVSAVRGLTYPHLSPPSSLQRLWCTLHNVARLPPLLSIITTSTRGRHLARYINMCGTWLFLLMRTEADVINSAKLSRCDILTPFTVLLHFCLIPKMNAVFSTTAEKTHCVSDLTSCFLKVFSLNMLSERAVTH